MADKKRYGLKPPNNIEMIIFAVVTAALTLSWLILSPNSSREIMFVVFSGTAGISFTLFNVGAALRSQQLENTKKIHTIYRIKTK